MKPNYPVQLLIVVVLIPLIAGCSLGKPLTAAPVPVLTGGSSRVWRTDFDRLEFDLRRTLIAVGWGIYTSDIDNHARTIVMRLQAPNERSASLTAEPDGQRTMRVMVRVGHMGDQYYESELLAMLDEKLTGEPGVPRQRGFELPPLQSNP